MKCPKCGTELNDEDIFYGYLRYIRGTCMKCNKKYIIGYYD